MPEKRSDEIRSAIMKQIFENNRIDINGLSEKFSVSPQSIYKQIYFLEDKKLIESKKLGRTKEYHLVELKGFNDVYDTSGLNEDEVFTRDFAGIIDGASDIARQVYVYVFTEMLNNAIEHSESEKVLISVDINAYAISCTIVDFGVGIFNKIQKSLGLAEKRYAILELAKGKFTTDPESHTGEGIFFSSKAADKFYIFSDELTFIGNNTNNINKSLIFDDQKSYPLHGTTVMFEIILKRESSLLELFNKYTQHPDDYGFTKTLVPVRLLEYQEANPIFVSRSQAKRLLARFERFENIILDFKDVAEIGQGFADEIFRVFQKQHPGCAITPINTNPKVDAMIRHVKDTRQI